MKRNVFRLVFGLSLSMVVGSAFAQHGGGHSGGGGGGGRSSGGGSRSSGGGGGFHFGGSGGMGSFHFGGSGRSSGSFGGTSRSSGSASRYSNENRSTFGERGFQSGRDGSRFDNHGSAGTRSFSQGRNTLGGRVGSESRVTGARENNLNNGHLGADPGRIDHAPVGLVRGGGGLRGRVFGDGRPGFAGGFRHGFFGYGPGWFGVGFFFPFYCYDPFFAPCYVSPWYYYPCLPPYVGAANVVVADGYWSQGWSGSDYDWEPYTERSNHPVLDQSVQDIVAAYENDDHHAIDRLVPHSGKVNVYVDGKYSYALNSNDFYDTYVDGIEGTKTDRLEIVSVDYKKDGTARVTAKHLYKDPWGKEASVYQTYFLKKEGNEFVIREFGTSNRLAGL